MGGGGHCGAWRRDAYVNRSDRGGVVERGTETLTRARKAGGVVRGADRNGRSSKASVSEMKQEEYRGFEIAAS